MTGKRILTVENLSGCIAIAWGLAVGNPYTDVFSKYPQIYHPMSELVPFKLFWAVLFAACGVGCLILNLKRKTRAASLLMAIVFMLYASLFFIGDVQTQGWAVYGLIGVFNYLHFQFEGMNKGQNGAV